MKTRKSKEVKASGVLKASRTKRKPLVDKTNDANSPKSIIKRKSIRKTKSPMVSTTKHNTHSDVKITTKAIKTRELKVNVVKTRKNQRNKLDLNVTLLKNANKMPNVSINIIPHRTRRVGKATQDLNEIPSNDLNKASSSNMEKETEQQQNNLVKLMTTNTESTVMPQNNIDGSDSKVEPTRKSKRILKSATNQLKSTIEKTPDEKQSDPLAVYEFKYDPKEEPMLKPKRRKRLRVNRISESSGEEDNTMKPIIRNLRKNAKIKQVDQTIQHNLRNRVVTNVSAPTAATTVSNTEKTSTKSIDNNIKFVSMVPVIQDYTKVKKHDRQVAVAATSSLPITKIDKVKAEEPQNKIKDIPVVENSEQIIPNNNDKIKNDHLSVADSSAIEVKEIVDTFMDDLDDDEDSNAIISTPSRIDILSNLIARKTYKPSDQVFNSTMINEPRPLPSSPWRIEMSVIPRKHQYFPAQNKSCTPSYTPDITNLASSKKQSTLLDFMHQTKTESKVPITLFENPFAAKSSPRKPFANLSNSPLSPIKQYRSKVSPKKQCIDGENDDFFGFSLISDTEADLENYPPVKKSPRKRNDIIKYTKNTKVSGKNTQNDQEVKVEEHATNISPVPLFEDLFDDKKPNPKRFSRQYTRQQPKRKRIVSFKSDCSDSEADDELTHHHHLKKKQKDVITKEEEEEAERLASHYNSMFEEIEHYPLCIE